MPEMLECVNVRMGASLLRPFDDWRRSQQKIPTRAEAARQLIGMALEQIMPTMAKLRLDIEQDG
jgi:hypothetical protein